MKQVIDFLTKNIKTITIVLLVIIFLVYGISRERRIARISAELATLKVIDDEIKKDRDSLNIQNKLLVIENKGIKHKIDSLKELLNRETIQLAIVIKKHKKEIDSLLNVPNDTIYVRLQPIYPNPAQEPLKYPFSGTQIRQIYTTAINYPMLQNEYGLQTGQLNTCFELNKKYEDSESNLWSQIDNLNKNISYADQQINNRDQQLKLTQKQLKRKTFWNWTFKGAAVAIGVYAILK
jgi:hypothetical protein